MEHPEKERLILERALEALAKETGLAARVVHRETRLGPDNGWDALIEVVGPEQAHQFAVQIKNKIDRFETLHQLRAFGLHDTRDQLIVVAPYITQQLAERCRELRCCHAHTEQSAGDGPEHLVGPLAVRLD